MIFMKIRKATEKDVTGIAYVHINSWQSTYKGILPNQYLTSLNLETRKKLAKKFKDAA